MIKYIFKRLFLILPTLLGITIVCFLILITSPGGPIEQKIAQIKFSGVSNTDSSSTSGDSNYGIPEDLLNELKKQYGFDKPIPIQYLIWLKKIVTLDFGDSYFNDEPVIDLILERIPISLQFGVTSLILTYLICIILGVTMAVRKSTTFDMTASIVIIVLYSIPPLMLGILLKIFLSGGSYLEWFPLGDIFSDMYFEKNFFGKILDRIHHFILPLLCYMIGSFTVLTQLMKNSLLEEINMDYVRTARAKGLSKKTVIYKHVLRNALIPIATSVGSIFGVFLTGSIIIETLFNINGIGLLAFESALSRDYNVIMALIFFQSLIFLAGRLFSDVVYTLIDPRIDFS